MTTTIQRMKANFNKWTRDPIFYICIFMPIILGILIWGITLFLLPEWIKIISWLVLVLILIIEFIILFGFLRPGNIRFEILLSFFALLVSFGSLAFVGFGALQQLKIHGLAYRPYLEIMPLAYSGQNYISITPDADGINIQTQYKIVNLGQVPAHHIEWRAELLEIQTNITSILSKASDHKLKKAPIIPLHKSREVIAQHSNHIRQNSVNIERLVKSFAAGETSLMMRVIVYYHNNDVENQEPMTTEYMLKIKQGEEPIISKAIIT